MLAKILGETYVTDEEILVMKERAFNGIQIKKWLLDTKKKITRSELLARSQNLEINVSDNAIYELMLKGLNLDQMVSHFNSRGIDVSRENIEDRCRCISSSIAEKEKMYAKRKTEDAKIEREKYIKERIKGLKKDHLTITKIVQILNNEGIKISRYRVKEIIHQLREEKAIDDSGYRISSEEGLYDKIFEMRQRGMSHEEIAIEFESQGKSIKISTVKRICAEIYAEKGLKQLNAKTKLKNDYIDNIIYELAERGATYKEIQQCILKQGRQMSLQSIGTRIRWIYKENGGKKPRKKRIISQIVDDEIFRLRLQGLSYDEIFLKITEKGYEIKKSQVPIRCKEIFKEKGLEEPKCGYFKDVLDDDIFMLRERKMSYEEIAYCFNIMGIEVSINTIKSRCRKVYKEKGMKEPVLKRGCKSKKDDHRINIANVDKNVVIEILKRLKTTRNATEEQLKKLAAYYGIEYDCFENEFIEESER